MVFPSSPSLSRHTALPSGSFLEPLLRFLYYVGTRVIRFGCHARRRLRLVVLRPLWALRLRRSLRREQPRPPLSQRLFGPLLLTAHSLKSYRLYRCGLFPQPTGQVAAHRPVTSLRAALRPAWQWMGGLVSHLLPLGGIGVLLWTALYFSNITYALRVEYNGQYVGYIQNESQFTAAQQQVYQRMIGGAAQSAPISPVYTLEIVQPDQLTPGHILTNNLIQAAGGEIQEATGLYVDNRFLGAVSDGEQLIWELKSLKEQDHDGSPNTQVSFVQPLRLEQGIYPLSSVVPLPSVMETLTSQVEGAQTYTVQPGDSPYSVAQQFDIPVSTLQELNPQVTQTMLVGQQLTISRAVPFLQNQVTKTVTHQQEVDFTTQVEEDNNKEKTYSEIVQEGAPGLTQITSQITYIDGVETQRQVISRQVLQPPVDQVIRVGTIVSSSTPAAPEYVASGQTGGKNAGGYIWPVAGGKLICPIWGYAGHTGNDIGADLGTPIFAAKSGTVVSAGWSNGYGYNVLLQHPDGTKTRYAHCSALGVVTGQQVNQGEQIANVGRTGWATTEHCHFEIIQNGSFLDVRDFF